MYGNLHIQQILEYSGWVLQVQEIPKRPKNKFTIWGFPKIIHFSGIFPLQTIHFGVPVFMETPICLNQTDYDISLYIIISLSLSQLCKIFLRQYPIELSLRLSHISPTTKVTKSLISQAFKGQHRETDLVRQDGRSSTLTAPNGPSQGSVMRVALSEAKMQPEEVAPRWRQIRWHPRPPKKTTLFSGCVHKGWDGNPKKMD